MTPLLDNIKSFWQGEHGVDFEYMIKWPDEEIKLIPSICISPCCEVGCGSGRIASLFAPKKYIGVDINPTAIEKAKKNLPDHVFELIDYEDEYPEASCYLFHTVLLHVPDAYIESVIRRCHNKMIVVAETMNRAYRDEIIVWSRDADEYEALFDSCGYQIAYDRTFKSPHTAWNLQVYSAKVNIQKLYSEAYYAARSQKQRLETPFRDDQKAALEYLFMLGRKPKTVLSIGCGEGKLEAEIEKRGSAVIAIEPGGGNCHVDKVQEVFDVVKHTELIKQADALVLTEVIEHLPLRSIEALLMLFQGKIVITNIQSYHPIRPNNIDHITLIDDYLYDWIASLGEVLYRNGSHLVVEKGGSD